MKKNSKHKKKRSIKKFNIMELISENDIDAIIKNLDKHDNLEDLLKHLKLKIELYENHPSRYYDPGLVEFDLEKIQYLKSILEKYNSPLYQAFTTAFPATTDAKKTLLVTSVE